ncbi:MAG: type II toxin-antitoxin system VapC family toxin [Phycisphaerae bacterium]
MDSCVVIDILEGEKVKNPWIVHLTRDAQAGKIRLMASAFAACEVSHIADRADDRKEIIAFFRRPDIDVFPLDIRLADYVREIIGLAAGLKPADAIHVATAVLHNATVLLTRDAGGGRRGKSVLALDGLPLPRGKRLRIMTPQHFDEMMAKAENKPLINGAEE